MNELAAALGDDPNFSTTIINMVGHKVDKVEGKDLSTNDFTTEEKEKLAMLEPHVQANWDQNDETAASYVRSRTHYTEINGEEEIVHHLDEKYIPETIARTSDIPSIAGLATEEYVDNKVAENSSQFVKTVNGTAPDENGDVDGFATSDYVNEQIETLNNTIQDLQNRIKTLEDALSAANFLVAD